MASFSVASRGPGLRRSVDQAAALGSIIQAHTVQLGPEHPLPPRQEEQETPLIPPGQELVFPSQKPLPPGDSTRRPTVLPQAVWTHKALDIPQLPGGW